MFLVKHLRPDIANGTTKLSKANDGVNPVAFNEFVIGHVLDKKNLGLKLEQTGITNKPWEIVCFRNSDYARDQ